MFGGEMSVKYGKYTLATFANFVYFCITHGKALPQNGRISPEVVHIQNLQTLQAYILRILQFFATKLGNFTNFKMLFLAVLKDFAFFANLKIQFKRGMVHYLKVHWFGSWETELG